MELPFQPQSLVLAGGDVLAAGEHDVVLIDRGGRGMRSVLALPEKIDPASVAVGENRVLARTAGGLLCAIGEP